MAAVDFELLEAGECGAVLDRCEIVNFFVAAWRLVQELIAGEVKNDEAF